jgi:drug/metabolite transporter (DMT)-like permease
VDEVDAVALALLSALLFAGMTVALRVALRGHPEAEAGAFATALVGFLVALAAAAISSGSDDIVEARELVVFALTGLLAPGASGVLFLLAIRDAGSSRASNVVGTAPLFGASMAIVFLGEPVRPALVAGAILVVGAGFLLVRDPVRPPSFREAGIAFALATTLLFSARDVVVRWYSGESEVGSLDAAAAAAAVGVATLVTLVWAILAARRSGRRLLRRELVRFVPAGILFGVSYVLLFEAYFRGRVTVVSPLVATESLWGVLLSALVLGRSELVGPRLVLGAALIVAGGALISTYR